MATIKYTFPYPKSGPMYFEYEVDEHWFNEFIKRVDSCVIDSPARDALIAHVMDHVAKPVGQCVGLAEFDYSPPRPQPIGYISESGMHMLNTGRKAFFKPEKDSLYVWPVYVGNK
jgi:hypothetical protein